MFRLSASALFAAASSVLGEETTTLPLIMTDLGSDYEGSVIGNAKGVATLSLDCVPGGGFCDLQDGITITQGASTYHFAFSTEEMPGYTLSRDIDCKLDPEQDIATCKDTIITNRPDKSFTIPDISTTDYSRLLRSVPITAGVEKLANTEAVPQETGHAGSTSKENAGPIVTANVVLAAAIAGAMAF